MTTEATETTAEVETETEAGTEAKKKAGITTETTGTTVKGVMNLGMTRVRTGTETPEETRKGQGKTRRPENGGQRAALGVPRRTEDSRTETKGKSRARNRKKP